ncbi:MAG: protein kinase [Acidobacteria bacterium]|nr:protein kinase [Acidobacteriota bacterium]
MIPIDTTGLPPGGTFEPTMAGSVGPPTVAPTVGEAPTIGLMPPTNEATRGLAATMAADATIGDAATMGPTPTFGGTGVAAHTEAGPLKVGQSFGPRYQILKLLGAGGMGAVYQAWDAELGVAVALKVIRTSKRRVSAELEKRFKNELLLARSVTHKNVVRIHDLGEIENTKYITMSFIQGHDLSTLLRGEGKCPIARALVLARQIAAGLEAAHEAGVVHRDLKPANIMISRAGDTELALIMDFGISASAEDATTGGVVGTLEYMAPEQGTGQAVDGRADIYAFGLILYELLTGPRLTTSVTPQMRIEAMKYRTTEGLPSIRSVDATIPSALESVVMRCIERDPAARFQTTTELVAALAALDDKGELIPIARRLTKPMLAAAAAVVVVLLSGTYFFTRRLVTPQKAHDPVSVLIADFQNQTGDATFDHALEPMIKRGLEEAGFISAYDRQGIREALGVQPPPTLDEGAARELAGKQGVGVVFAGTVARQASGYAVSVRALETVTGKVIASARGRAASNDQILRAVTGLIPTVRKALGDTNSDSGQMFAMASVSATSTDVLRYYAAAREASSNLKYDEAQRNYAKAVELDPKFGIGYEGLAALAWNQNHVDEAQTYIKQALGNVDGMTERERYTTRGLYYTMSGDYQSCIKEYSDLVGRYPYEVLAHNNLALCLSYVRNMPRAVAEMKRLTELLPNRALFRINFALYVNYASDFATAEREGRTLREMGREQWGLFNIALAQAGQGALADASSTFQQLAGVPRGASQAASGLGDLAIQEGRFADAVRIFDAGAAADLKAGDRANAAAKFAAIAHAQLMRRATPRALQAAEQALANNKAVKIQFLAGRIYVEAGETTKANQLIADLGSGITAEPQAYAKVLSAEMVLKGNDARQAIKLLSDANTLLDTWIGHFDLGRAYLAANALPQADSEFDRCLKRRGEALALFLDEEPTYGFFPPVYYYQGRVREALGNAGFADSYRAYLSIRGKSTEDPLLPEVRRRASR